MPTREVDLPNYPGLNAVATAIWRDFLKLYESKFASFEYNVRVGQGITPPAGASAEDAALWKQLTQKRIDVVATRMGETWIIEIDERPGSRVFGQLQLYKHMYPLYYPVKGKLQGALVCRYLGYDMFGAFHQQGDYVFKFQTGKLPSLPPTFLPAEGGAAFDLLTGSTA